MWWLHDAGRADNTGYDKYYLHILDLDERKDHKKGQPLPTGVDHSVKTC